MGYSRREGIDCGLGQGLSHPLPLLGDFDAYEIWTLVAIAGVVILLQIGRHRRLAIRPVAGSQADSEELN